MDQSAPPVYVPDKRRWCKLPARALSDPMLTNGDIKVLACIGLHADEHGIAWPSQGYIAETIHMARTSVNRCVRRLEKHGYLELERTRRPDGGIFVRYRVIYPAFYSIPSRHGRRAAQAAM